MIRLLRICGVAATVAMAALFMVLPQTGGDARVKFGVRGVRPATLHVARGARVQFINDTRRTHTATCRGCGWDTGDVQPGQSSFITFRTDGAYTYICRYHRGESATLLVGNATAPAPQQSTPLAVPSA